MPNFSEIYDKLNKLEHFLVNVHKKFRNFIVNFFFENTGGGENNLVKSSTIDQYHYILRKSMFYIKNLRLNFIKIYIKTHKIALYIIFTYRIHALKQAATYIILFYTKCSFKNIATKSDQNIHVHQNAPNYTISLIKYIFGEHTPEPSSRCADDIIISI